MTDQDYTAIAILLDRSGSMDLIKADAQGALNEFVKSQRELPGKATLTFAQFCTHGDYELVYQNKPIAEVEDIVLKPRGMTALHDAMGDTITKFGESLAAMPEAKRPGKVLFVIVTDGLENDSKEWDTDQVFKLVTEQKDRWNWEFIFLAAHEDAVREAARVGIPKLNTMSWEPTAAGTRSMGEAAVSYASSYRTTGKGKFNKPNDED
jgi:hypothetical protein